MEDVAGSEVHLSRMLESIYLKDTQFLECKVKGNVSYPRHIIVRARERLRDGFSCMLQQGDCPFGIGNGLALEPYVSFYLLSISVILSFK